MLPNKLRLGAAATVGLVSVGRTVKACLTCSSAAWKRSEVSPPRISAARCGARGGSRAASRWCRAASRYAMPWFNCGEVGATHMLSARKNNSPPAVATN